MEFTPGLEPMVQKTGEAILRGMVTARHVVACNAEQAAKLPHAIDSAMRPELSMMCRGWQRTLCPDVSCDSHRAAAVGSTGGGAGASGTAVSSGSAAEAAPDDEDQPLSLSSPVSESGTQGQAAAMRQRQHRLWRTRSAPRSADQLRELTRSRSTWPLLRKVSSPPSR